MGHDDRHAFGWILLSNREQRGQCPTYQSMRGLSARKLGLDIGPIHCLLARPPGLNLGRCEPGPESDIALPERGLDETSQAQ